MMSGKKSHEWYNTSLKGIPWAVCAKCGLIRFNNPKTDKKVRQACPGSEEDK